MDCSATPEVECGARAGRASTGRGSTGRAGAAGAGRAAAGARRILRRRSCGLDTSYQNINTKE